VEVKNSSRAAIAPLQTCLHNVGFLVKWESNKVRDEGSKDKRVKEGKEGWGKEERRESYIKT
jgi:hypothetical protein